MYETSLAYDGPWNSIPADLLKIAAGELHVVHIAPRPGCLEPGPGR